ncbi:MAG: hypothetical protein R3Y07_03005 [Eubacteriales bacterium]
MNGIDIYEGLGHISDKMIQEAEQTTGKLSSKSWIRKGYTAMVASIALVVGIGLSDNSGSDGVKPEDFVDELGGVSGSSSEMTGSSESSSVTGETQTTDKWEQVYTATKLENVKVELLSLQSEGFQCVVQETSNPEIHPVHSKLFVIFEENTTVFTWNGEEFLYNELQENALELGWEIGTLIEVDYLCYEVDQENGYNKIYAENVNVLH